MHSEEDIVAAMEGSKYVRYTAEQVEALERLYNDCPKPSSLRRQQLIRECPILSNIEPKQIKVWFQNRRCREKQRKEAARLQTVNRKLTAMNKLLMEENDRLQKQVSHLVYENGYLRQQIQAASFATTDTSCESAVTSGAHQQQHMTPQRPPRDASPAGFLSIAEETLTQFISKAKETAVDWIHMPGMKPGPDSIGIVTISNNCPGVAARTCGFVGLEPAKVAEILKDRPSWLHDCRSLDVLTSFPTGKGGTIELLYTQMYAPTTWASAHYFWTLRYTSYLEDGSLVVCERSLTGNVPNITTGNSIRAEMFPSGYLIRPCEGGGSVINVVDHIDWEPWSIREVIRPMYESSAILAQKMTITALRHLRQLAQEASGEAVLVGWGRQPAALRAFSQRLCRGFNEAVNGFLDDGWTVLGEEGADGISIAVNSSSNKFLGVQLAASDALAVLGGGVLCAKASILLENVPPAVLIRFLREHRSEWADCSFDGYSPASIKTGFSNSRGGMIGSQVILPLAHTVENEEFLEVIKLERNGMTHEEALMSKDMFLLQLCAGVDEDATGNCSQLIFAPIDASFADDAPLLPSGFRIIPLESGVDDASPNRTLDLASALEVGGAGARNVGDQGGNQSNLKSVLTIAFQFTYQNHLQEHMAAMARQYVRRVIASVLRVAMALSPQQTSHLASRSLPGMPEAVTFARWICQSYRLHLGIELSDHNCEPNDNTLKLLWNHPNAILCCSCKALPVFTFANQAGLDMLETTLVALQDISLEKVLDENGRKKLCTDFTLIMQQGYATLPAGICISSMGRPVAYDRAIAWKVLNDEDDTHCIAFMFMNWMFM